MPPCSRKTRSNALEQGDDESLWQVFASIHERSFLNGFSTQQSRIQKVLISELVAKMDFSDSILDWQPNMS